MADFPLRGHWSAAHSPATRIPSHGTNQLGQRYAFDLWRLDDRKHPHPAGAMRTWLVGVRTRECYGYGEPIHAALEGKVVRARDGTEEVEWLYPAWEILKVIGNAFSFRLTERLVNKIAGNHVVVESDVAHAFYAHMVPGSVAVTEGQTVRKGEVLGRVGSTGNSTAPHLHFQLMDRADLLTAEGVPCAFAAYDVVREGRWVRVTDGVPTITDRIRSV